MDFDIASMRGYQTPLVNSTLLPMLLLSMTNQRYTPKTATTIQSEYDFVIVGAGSAGSVLARRLTEISCISVLLLEAGPPPPLLTEVPSLTRAFYNSEIDWKFKTTPQKYAAKGINGRQVPWPTGKTLGGSSVLNAGLYVRGNQKNYDRWAAEGAKGWSYKDVLPYFKKLEDNRDPEYVANGYHGVGGPQTVHRPRYQAEIKQPIVEAVKSMGYKFVDPNGPWQTGFYDIQGTLRSGQRCTTAKAYLVPAENRTNLDILPFAYVQKILIHDRRAVGVQFEVNGTTYRVKAKREVIMSAGTVNTAQLLMLSGIGPKKELQRFKIPVIADLPVGQNLQDHSASFAAYTLSPTISPVTVKIVNPVNIAQYMQNRTGPLGSPEFISILGFLKNWAITPKVDFPDHQIYLVEAVAFLALQIGVTPEVYSQVFLAAEGKPLMACLSMSSNPRSKGKITLQSDDPYEPPLIDPNYFEDPRDIKDIAEGLKDCNRIATSHPLRRVGATPLSGLIPGCEQYIGKEDLYFWCQATTLTITCSNPVGTARMGDPKDPRTVVDPQLRVKHIKGLRVVDASIIPVIPSGNINVPVIMIAEKASDIIKSSINCHNNHGQDDYLDKNKEESWEEEEPSWKEKEHSWKEEESSWKEDEPSYKEKEHTWKEKDPSWKKKEKSWKEKEQSWKEKEEWKEKEPSWKDEEEEEEDYA